MEKDSNGINGKAEAWILDSLYILTAFYLLSGIVHLIIIVY